MQQNYYPTAQQVLQELYAANLVSMPLTANQAQIDVEGACEYAWQAWERLTGYTPFLADAAETTYDFMPDGSTTLALLGGFVTISSVAINGNAATLNTDYRTFPMNAVLRNRPITYLKFDRSYGRFISLLQALPGHAGSVQVTGRRGAYNVLPALATQAIIALAVTNLLGNLEFLKFNGLLGWKIGTDERTYAQKPFANILANYQNTLSTGLGLMRRQRIG